MAVTFNTFWDDAGTVIPGGQALYAVNEQPIAEYDNHFNSTIVTAINDLIAEVVDRYNANTILKADTDNTPIALTVAEDRILGRKLGSSIDALNAVDIEAILAGTPLSADLNFDGNDITNIGSIYGLAAMNFRFSSGVAVSIASAPGGDITSWRPINMGAYEIKNPGNVDGRDVSADGTKLDGIESGADVTDATNVGASGAIMYTGLTGDISCDDGAKILHQAGPPFTIHGDIRNIAAASHDVLYNIMLLDGWKINVLAASIDKRGINSCLRLYDTTHSAQIYNSGSVVYEDSGNNAGTFPVSSTAAGITHYEVRLHNITAGAIDAGGFMVLQVETT